jgi:pSer/pThr/pTyr-binding forkhead associated (FHA) protein
MARIIFTLEDGTEIEAELDSDIVTVGRNPDSAVVLPSPSVSGNHATIKRRGDGYFVQDLGTTNGTKLNGVDVEEARLEHGDRLSFGDVPAVVQLTEKPAVAEAPPKPVSYPMPNAPLATAPPVVGVGLQPPQRRGPRRGSGTYRPPSEYNQGSGCAGFIGLLVFLFVAFVAGMCIRHYKEHQSFLLQDVYKKYMDKSEHEDSMAPAKPGAGTPAKVEPKQGAEKSATPPANPEAPKPTGAGAMEKQ